MRRLSPCLLGLLILVACADDTTGEADATNNSTNNATTNNGATNNATPLCEPGLLGSLCASDSDCAEGFGCQGDRCVPRCSTDEECNYGCAAFDTRCTNAEASACDDDEDCRAFECGEDTSCTTDARCATDTGPRCVGGLECASDSDCAEVWRCIDGTLCSDTRERYQCCVTSADCADPAEVCTQGQCRLTKVQP